jgi:hypothetical protein
LLRRNVDHTGVAVDRKELAVDPLDVEADTRGEETKQLGVSSERKGGDSLRLGVLVKRLCQTHNSVDGASDMPFQTEKAL